MNSSMYVDNNGGDTLILGEGPTKESDDMALTIEAKCPIKFTQSRKKLASSLQCNGSNSF